ncbi:MAG TPA: DUF91 domain-containing protein [Candidatus Bathyarchaeota archaeon]|nr:DUF91 domain-containing protein [Candidatus Bathyarchaeota archaeon]
MKPSRAPQVLENPSLGEAAQLIKKGIAQKKTVIIACHCTVDYEGRANSTLGPGDRVVLIKPDGSALVHRPKDYAPVNWQPPGSLFKTTLKEGEVELRAYRRKEKERMVVHIKKVTLAAALELRDSGEFTLYASERDMQEAILLEPSLLEEGFRPVTKERPVDPGFIDVMGYDSDGNLVLVEIKRGRADKNSVEQLKKYMDVVDRDDSRRVRGLLVAPEATRGALKLLAQLGYEFKPLTPQKCSEVLRRRRATPLTRFLSGSR